MYYSEKEARELVLKAGLMLKEKHLISRTWGNVSARIGKDEFIITPSGKAYEDISEADLSKVKISTLEWEGKYKPSSEKGVHAECYLLRKDCNFVIHTHQFYASAICAEEKDVDFAPCAAYAFSGTEKLRNNIGKKVSDNPSKKCFLMSKHGAIVLGNSYEEAFELAMDLEDKCKALFEKEKHQPKKGAYIDDYAMLFDRKGRPVPGEDKEAIDYVGSKNEAASSYVKTAKPLSWFKHTLEHKMYVKKYSKLKDSKCNMF